MFGSGVDLANMVKVMATDVAQCISPNFPSSDFIFQQLCLFFKMMD